MDSLFSNAKKQWELVENLYTAVEHKNAAHLIQLRWIAVIGQLSTIAVVNLILNIPLPTPAMLGIVIFQVAFNIASELRWRESVTVANGELFLALLVDVATLTAELYLSGGTQNPFAFLYLLQVSISAVLLETWATWFIIIITGACLAGLSAFSMPLDLPHDKDAIAPLYSQGMIICFILNATLLTIFIKRISRNLSEGETQLAELKQRAAEEDHIVRMGLLASGAAHELGTPLATLSVILGDWQRMPAFNKHKDIKPEMDEMQMQLDRCKSIISGILLSAGEVRSESSTKTTINGFLNDLIEEWRNARTIVSFEFENRIKHDRPVAFDTTLKQMIFNVLDNALEASPNWVKLEVNIASETLFLTVTDAGSGFTSAMLAQFGKPYQSTKNRPGRGLGLFFVVNVARKLGGKVTPSNRADFGGAIVRLEIPLGAINLSE